MKYLFLLFPILVFAEDGKLSTEASVATVSISVVIPQKAEVNKEDKVLTNVENPVIIREGSTITIYPDSR